MMSGRFHRVFGKFAAPANTIASEALGPVLPTVDGCSRPDADEPEHRVRLPASGLHDLGQRCAFGALHHGDYFRFLVGALGLGLSGCLLDSACLLLGLRLLGLALAIGRRSFNCRRAGVLRIYAHIAFLLLPQDGCGRDIHHSVSKKGKHNLGNQVKGD